MIFEKYDEFVSLRALHNDHLAIVDVRLNGGLLEKPVGRREVLVSVAINESRDRGLERLSPRAGVGTASDPYLFGLDRHQDSSATRNVRLTVREGCMKSRLYTIGEKSVSAS
jgi:hypothetical protein